MTPGNGLEWAPTITGDGTTLVFISATPQRPPLPATKAFGSPRGATRTIGADHIPGDFPSGLVTPRQVVFRSADGLTIHGQLFESSAGGARKPAIVYVHGGSYGGYLTALALARNSDVFAAGVDIHGVHDWTTQGSRAVFERQRYEQAPDITAALDTAFRSSPISSVSSWKSPVLLIHGDDDRNVRFSQSTDLVRRLAAAGVRFETLVIPDDTHHFLRYANILTVDRATAEFLERRLLQASAAPTPATGRQ